MPYSERHLPKSEEAKQEDLAGSETVLTWNREEKR
jgi:hypothetical protein